MSVNSLSLRFRSLLVALIALLLFTPTAFFTLDKAYQASLMEATYQQLKLNALMLVTEYEFVDDIPSMPFQVYDEQLNLQDSGVYGFVQWGNILTWQSSSSFDQPIPQLPEPPKTGDENFVAQGRYFIYSFTAEFQTSNGFSPVHFHIVYDKRTFEKERSVFVKRLWQSLFILAALLLLCLLLGMRFLLKPLRRLRNEIRATSSGEQPLVSEDYPTEITPLTSSINQLISIEEQQRERYKNSLSDLAHSLKTPLTVALVESNNQPQLQQPLREIEAIIQRQLKRAATQKPGWQTPISVNPVIFNLINAMQKVHADKSLSIDLEAEQEYHIAIESTDLMECVGNVLDNACKAANSRVTVQIETRSNSTDIIVDDDGPGINIHDKQRLMSRGQRLDTYSEGQGIGMAVVSDIISSYGGKLGFEKAPIGGARVRLSFNRN